MLSSQSISLGSLTVWSPIIEDISLTSDTWKTLHAQTENTLRVIENLTPVQKKLMGESNNLNIFFPHIGVFSKDYFLASLLLKK